MKNLTSADRIAIMRALNLSITQWDEIIINTEDKESKKLYINTQKEEKQAFEKIAGWYK